MRVLLACTILWGVGGSAFAALPEPDTIIWGEITNPDGFAAVPNTVVEVRRGSAMGEVLASYTIDHDGPAGTGFLTRVGMVTLESGDVLGPGEVEVGTGEAGRVVVDGVDIGATVSLDERGTVQTVNYSDWTLQDSDGDGLPDYYEGLVGSDIDLADTDGDGMSDLLEYLAGSDPTDPGDVPLRAGVGDIDGDGVITLGDLLILTRYVKDGVGSVSLEDGDIAPLGSETGDGAIDSADVLVLMRFLREGLKQVPEGS